MLEGAKKENICINQIIKEKTEEVEVENNVIIPDAKPDILSAINTNCTVCIYKKEVMDGKIRIDGSLILYIMYLPDNQAETIRTINTSLDFTQILDIEESRENMALDCNIKIKGVECKVLNGRKVNIKATMIMDIKLYSNDNVELITGIENDNCIQVLTDTMDINSLVGRGETQVSAKENLAIDNIDEIAEIMKIDLSIINRDIKISYNKVLAKADLYVKIMYLTEDGRINIVSDKIPVMGFIDIQNISEDSICEVSYNIKNVVVKINNTESHGIYIEVPIELVCTAYEKKTINVIQDLYSTKEDVSFENKIVKAMSEKKITKNVLNVDEQIQIPEIIGHKLYDVEVNPVIINQNISKDKVIIDGNILLKFIFEAENSKMINIRNVEIPLNFSTEIQGINKNDSVNSRMDVVSQDFIIGQNGTIDCKISLEYEINTSSGRTINLIDNLNVQELSKDKSYSMIIYFAKQGDTLWKIAKKFNSTVEDIVEVNNIEDSDKIKIGQQLFIPKYINKKSA
ncbi:MAG: DUF3794 domain-containing protein [Clostridia bacterium]|nr:DUF3794 domain-containing protein [Clostridia bacterium]